MKRQKSPIKLVVRYRNMGPIAPQRLSTVGRNRKASTVASVIGAAVLASETKENPEF